MKGRRPAELDDPDRRGVPNTYGLQKPYGIVDADYGRTYLKPLESIADAAWEAKRRAMNERLDSDDEEQEHVRRMVEGEAAMARARHDGYLRGEISRGQLHGIREKMELERLAALSWLYYLRWFATGLAIALVGVLLWSRVF